MASDEAQLRRELDELQKKLGKKQQFEEAVASISSIVTERYSSASPSLRSSVLLLFSSSFSQTQLQLQSVMTLLFCSVPELRILEFRFSFRFLSKMP
jgi:hypothetical protein